MLDDLIKSTNFLPEPFSFGPPELIVSPFYRGFLGGDIKSNKDNLCNKTKDANNKHCVWTDAHQAHCDMNQTLFDKISPDVCKSVGGTVTTSCKNNTLPTEALKTVTFSDFLRVEDSNTVTFLMFNSDETKPLNDFLRCKGSINRCHLEDGSYKNYLIVATGGPAGCTPGSSGAPGNETEFNKFNVIADTETESCTSKGGFVSGHNCVSPGDLCNGKTEAECPTEVCTFAKTCKPKAGFTPCEDASFVDKKCVAATAHDPPLKFCVKDDTTTKCVLTAGKGKCVLASPAGTTGCTVKDSDGNAVAAATYCTFSAKTDGKCAAAKA